LIMADSITLDVTPTWAGLMPGLILALTHGTREGRRMAAEAPKAAARSEALEMARSCLGAYPPADLERQKGGAAWRQTATDLRDALAGLVASMEEGAGQ
jgi:hypothetical protein